MRALRAALLAMGATLLMATAAAAAPTGLTVRIEGEARTLFEGPVLSDGHDVRAASDSVSRRCDGTNNGANPTPGPTATAAGVDAMAIAGEDFDGRWFEGYDDYYVERWGPDSESFLANDGGGAFWGILVDGELSPLGGCQTRVGAGEEVLWAWDAFNLSKPFLRLAAAAAPASPVAYVDAGEALELSVAEQAYGGVLGEPPATQPAAGVPVRLVATEPGTGFQTPGTLQALSEDDGSAEVSFDSPGWRRLKAAEDGSYIRSNRLDVCVRPAGGGDCGPLPADAQPRTPPVDGGGETPPDGPAITPDGPAVAPAGGEAAPGRAARLALKATRAHPARGTATVALAVPGAGRIVLFGAAIRPRAATAEAATTLRLPVLPRRGTRLRLLATGRARVTVRARFLPREGAAQALRRGLTLRMER